MDNDQKRPVFVPNYLTRYLTAPRPWPAPVCGVMGLDGRLQMIPVQGFVPVERRRNER